MFDGCDYDSNIAINHAVQLVGYGSDPDLGDYFTIRNSWGAEFGEAGFIRIRRDAIEDTKCGTDTTPLIGTACENDGQVRILFEILFGGLFWGRNKSFPNNFFRHKGNSQRSLRGIFTIL